VGRAPDQEQPGLRRLEGAQGAGRGDQADLDGPQRRQRGGRAHRLRDRTWGQKFPTVAACRAARAPCLGTDCEGRSWIDAAAIKDEAPAQLIVDPPIPEQLALGRVFIQFQTENLRILPVFGGGALSVSPRVGHMHYFVDDQSWPIVDTSGETLVLVGMAPGQHKVVLELADPTHKAIPGARQTLTFTVPDIASHPH
jgi:hypothetical protein